MKRRDFLKVAALSPLLFHAAEAQEVSPFTVVGDVSNGRARLLAGGLGFGPLTVDWSAGSHAGTAGGGVATFKSDQVAHVELEGLPSGTEVSYRAQVGRREVTGEFKTPPVSPDEPVTLLWGGDVVGQGWGIDPAQGGMLTFRSMLREKPHFFIHCGDSIYADNALSHTVEKGTLTWNNIVTPAKSKPAETLREFYGNYSYNFLDEHYRDFFSQVPVVAQWDDHEVVDNWSPLDDRELSQTALRAFTTYWPIRSLGQKRLYRRIPYGPNLEVFVLDLRSYRAPNGDNRQKRPSSETAMLGREQLDWLKNGLAESKATWKVVAGEMPIATFAPEFGLDSWANGPGAPLGREFELAELFQHGLKNEVKNVVWLAADVHYAAAFHFQPERAVWKKFLPFWEFVAGPLHAGTFAPLHPPDNTFGAEEVFLGVPRDLAPNRPPSEGLQFYGKMTASQRNLRVSLHQREGREIYSVSLGR